MRIAPIATQQTARPTTPMRAGSAAWSSRWTVRAAAAAAAWVAPLRGRRSHVPGHNHTAAAAAAAGVLLLDKESVFVIHPRVA